MNMFIVMWVVMLVIWLFIIRNYSSLRRPNDRNDINHSGPRNETNHSFRHYNKNKKQQKSRRKDFKDSGLVDDDEYDVRDL